MIENNRLYGTDEPPAEWRTLVAGPLSAQLEAGQVRYLRYGSTEILRGISFLVRDEQWGTFPNHVSDLVVEETATEFSVAYSLATAVGHGDLQCQVRIVGLAKGELRFEVSGSPAQNLVTNRLGFVVLFPVDGMAGARVVIRRTDDSLKSVMIPRLVSAHEPAKDIRAIIHRPSSMLSVTTVMTGDAYDMEDQRNWTDASFKAYIRPLSKPRPYSIAGGTTIAQQVHVSIDGVPGALAGSRPNLATIGKSIGLVPRIALGLEGKDVLLASRWIERLWNAGARAIVGRPADPSEVDGIASVARALGAELQLEFAIPGIDPDTELNFWAEIINRHAVTSVLATPFRLYPLRPADVPAGNATLADIARAARRAFPACRIGGGVMTGFTEFNRNPPPLEAVDFVSHVTTAIVHAADDRSVMETIDALPDVFSSAHALAAGKTYRIGPSGIGVGLNPDGPPRRSDGHRQTMVRNDPRHHGQFGAAWTFAWLQAACFGDVEQVAPASLVGDFGVVFDDGTPRPVFEVVARFARIAGSAPRPIDGLPAGVRGLAIDGRLLLANLTPVPQTVAFASGHFALGPFAVEQGELP